jgi:hypothetical protein
MVALLLIVKATTLRSFEGGCSSNYQASRLVQLSTSTSHYLPPIALIVDHAFAPLPCIVAQLLPYAVLLLCTFPIFSMALEGIKEKLKKLESKIIHPSKHDRDQDTAKSASQPPSRDGDRNVGSSHGSPRDQQHSKGTMA